MVNQQALTKSRLRIEESSKEIVLVVCDGVSSADVTVLANEVAKKVAKEGKRRALIHVISPLGRPKYFEVVRGVIQENIGISMSVRYSGSETKDLLELVKRLNNPDVVVTGLCGDYIKVLDEVGYRNVTVIYAKEAT